MIEANRWELYPISTMNAKVPEGAYLIAEVYVAPPYWYSTRQTTITYYLDDTGHLCRVDAKELLPILHRVNWIHLKLEVGLTKEQVEYEYHTGEYAALKARRAELNAKLEAVWAGAEAERRRFEERVRQFPESTKNPNVPRDAFIVLDVSLEGSDSILSFYIVGPWARRGSEHRMFSVGDSPNSEPVEQLDIACLDAYFPSPGQVTLRSIDKAYDNWRLVQTSRGLRPKLR